jgi:hypothetical protein
METEEKPANIKSANRPVPGAGTSLPGWGIDADPSNNPTHPMKNSTGADHDRLNYARAQQQTRSVEVLQSNERPTLTRVFGTSIPPSGLSGILRRYAFRFSEGSAGHWLTLIFADRINAVEGIADDLRRGTVPNIFSERGWGAAWKYDRKNVVKKAAIATVVTAAAITFFILRSRRNKK